MNSEAPSSGGRSMQDMVGGTVLVLISALALYLVNHLPAAGRVGFASGTAPRLFAWGLLALGVAIAAQGFLSKSGEKIGETGWRGLVTIIGSVLFFAFSIRTFGLAVTGIPMVMLASLAAPGGNWKESLIFAVCMTTFCCVLFAKVLGQPIPLWPTF